MFLKVCNTICNVFFFALQHHLLVLPFLNFMTPRVYVRTTQENNWRNSFGHRFYVAIVLHTFRSKQVIVVRYFCLEYACIVVLAWRSFRLLQMSSCGLVLFYGQEDGLSGSSSHGATDIDENDIKINLYESFINLFPEELWSLDFPRIR